jgi:hypothetical protein
VQNLSKQFEFLSTKVVPAEFLPRQSPFITSALRTLKNTLRVVFGAAIAALIFGGPSPTDMHHILS